MKIAPIVHCTLASLALAAANAQPEQGPQQDDASAPTTTLPEVVVTGKAEDLLGTAPSASKGQASAEDIDTRPFLRRGVRNGPRAKLELYNLGQDPKEQRNLADEQPERVAAMSKVMDECHTPSKLWPDPDGKGKKQ
jgi:hypothetical protein